MKKSFQMLRIVKYYYTDCYSIYLGTNCATSLSWAYIEVDIEQLPHIVNLHVDKY